MTKEEAKHISEVLKAYSEGKTVFYHKKNDTDNMYVWTKYNGAEIDNNYYEYCIKPEPNYRPYNDAEEFFKAQKEHGPYLQRINYSGFRIPQFVCNKGIRFSDVFEETPKYKDLLKLWKWQDGTHCGVLE